MTISLRSELIPFTAVADRNARPRDLKSDRVMAHVLNMLCGGTRLEHLELLRNNEALLNAVGADSIPNPTTAGDFCRRFTADDLDSLTSAIHAARRNVWSRRPEAFFDEAVIDVDGVIVGLTGGCKEMQGRHGHLLQRNLGLSHCK